MKQIRKTKESNFIYTLLCNVYYKFKLFRFSKSGKNGSIQVDVGLTDEEMKRLTKV
jgi:hypothetical protein